MDEDLPHSNPLSGAPRPPTASTTNAPPPSVAHTDGSKTNPSPPKGKKKKGRVGEEKHKKKTHNVVYKSWEDEYKGDQKILYDRLAQQECVRNTMLIGGKIWVGNKIVVPPTMLLPVLKYLHSFSHTRKRNFIEIFSRTFSWQGEKGVLRSSIDRVHSSCQLCQSLRRQTGKKQDTLTHYPVPENIFSSICKDLSEMPQ